METVPDVPRRQDVREAIRGYEVALIVTDAGFHDARMLDGDLTMWPYEKIE